MLRLLQIEFQKLWLNRTSRILIYVSFVFPLSILVLSSLKIDIFGRTLDLSQTQIFDFPYIWHISTFFIAFFKFFFAIVVVSMIGNEYSNGTLKQNLIDGLSKKEMILSKFYFIVAYAFIVTALVFFITLFIGLANAPKSNMFLDIIFDGTEYIVAYFFKLVAFFSLCFFAGVIIKRSAFALGALFIVFITEMILLALTWNEWANEQVAVAIFKYMPFTSMWRLINQPVYRMANVNNPDSQLITDYAVHGYEIAIASGWIFISIFLSYQLLKRRDL